MRTRRQVLLPLALAPVAGWTVWSSGSAEPTHPLSRFHLPMGDSTALWRDLALVRLNGPVSGPEFPARVKGLDGKAVALCGFMIPLSGGIEHSRFILAANPVGCAACENPVPATMLHVHVRSPVRATREPVVVAGTLRIKPDEGLFYRLERAELRDA
ncbi:MAG TPA: DUF3299 domain-containing protein [Azospirillum sp.]|nr:DUF3299 domain-containing protein [Azospirillum sp.]